MKKLVTFFIPILIVLASCDSGEEVSPSPIDLVLEDIRDNQDILNRAFANGGVSVGAGDVNDIKAASESKREFVLAMTEHTMELFVKAIEETQPSMAAYIKFDGVDGESKETSARILKILTSGGEEPMPDYYSLLKKEAGEISPAVWTLLKNYRNAAGEEKPLEQMSLNYEEISVAITFSDLLVSSASDQEQAEAIEELAAKENIPPALIGLLLPAVQKMKGEEATDPLLQWLDNAVGEEINGGLNRDIIRRYKTAGYLAGLDQLIHSRYDNSNQHSASAQILRANFEATMMFAWADVWDRMEN